MRAIKRTICFFSLFLICSLPLQANVAELLDTNKIKNFKNTPSFDNAKKLLVLIYDALPQHFQRDFYCGAPIKKGSSGYIVKDPGKYVNKNTYRRQIQNVIKEIKKIKGDKILKTLKSEKGYQSLLKASSKKLPAVGNVIALGSAAITIGTAYVSIQEIGKILSAINQARFGLEGKIEWEHIMPASKMLDDLQECKIGYEQNKESYQSPRDYCQRTNSVYRKRVSDLHNLVPAIAQINRDRKDIAYSEQNKTSMKNKKNLNDFNDLRKCGYRQGDVFLPRADARGWIARTMLYMEKMYGINLKEEKGKYENWARRYRPSQKEVKVRQIINTIMGIESTRVMNLVMTKYGGLSYAK